MDTVLKKWGNSTGVRIPKEILAKSNLKLNDEVNIVAVDGGILLKAKRGKVFSDIVKPVIRTQGFKFDREEANER